VYADWGFAHIKGIGWGWAGIIWLYSIVTYVPLDFFKFLIAYALSGKAWNTLLENKVLIRNHQLMQIPIHVTIGVCQKNIELKFYETSQFWTFWSLRH
jgi:hypothetical protein